MQGYNTHDHIPTKKKKVKYSFITNETSPDKRFQQNYSATRTRYDFFQICDFRTDVNHSYPNKYQVRRFVVNQNNEYDSIKDYYLNKKEYRRLLKKQQPHTYRRFNLNTLEYCDPPSFHDINTAKSEILHTDSGFTGYAPF